MKSIFAALAAGLLSAAAAAQPEPGQYDNRDPFDPRAFQSQVLGDLTEIFVLGTQHLSRHPDLDPAVLSLVLERLEAFAPDVITIEMVPGEILDHMARHSELYSRAHAFFGGSNLQSYETAQEALGLSLPEAAAAARRTLAEWPETPAAEDRRRLTGLFLAAGDPASALVQWLRLPEEERTASEAFPAEAVEALEDFHERWGRSEIILIAVELAVRLGHERVYPTDDQSAWDVMTAIFPAVDETLALPENAVIFEHPLFTEYRASAEDLSSAEGMLGYLRRLNSNAYGHVDADGQWLVMLNRPFPDHAGRLRMAEWDVRNLHMTARIRKASVHAPGGRVLTIVGASHKAWFDAILELMPDMRVVHADEVLHEAPR